MMLSLLSALTLALQPAPADANAIETEVEVRAEAEAEANANPDEEVVCRRRLIPSVRIGQRHRVVRDCRPRSEWEDSRRRDN